MKDTKIEDREELYQMISSQAAQYVYGHLNQFDKIKIVNEYYTQ